METFSDGLLFALGMIAGLVAFLIGAILLKAILLLAGRYRQVGRKGYGFELQGWERVKAAVALFLQYDIHGD